MVGHFPPATLSRDVSSFSSSLSSPWPWPRVPGSTSATAPELVSAAKSHHNTRRLLRVFIGRKEPEKDTLGFACWCLTALPAQTS